MPRTVARTIAAILQDAQLIREQDVEAALVRQRETGRRIGETLVELGAVTEEDIGWALAKQFGLPFVDVPLEALDQDLIRGFQEGLLFSLEAVPLVRAERSLSVAIADPTDGAVLEALEEAAGCPVHTSVATRTAIHDALTAILGTPKEPHLRAAAVGGQRFDVRWDRSGATFLLFHVTRALDDGANGIHFIGGPDACRVSYRAGTQLHEVTAEPLEVMDPLLGRLAALGGPRLGTAETHVTGQALCPRGDHDILLDISLLRHDTGISVTLGLQRWSQRAPGLEELGFDALDLARVRAMLDRASGLILVSGPARSGVSTTLAAMTLASAGRAIAFEGRVGARLPAQTRLTLDPARARECWSGIAVAQEADVVVLSDLLQGEDVVDVMRGAGAGRRVLAGTDWTDSFAMLEQLMTAPAARHQLAARLQLVVQQRVVQLAQPAPGRPETRAPAFIALFEMLHVTEPMRELLGAGGPVGRLRALALADGMRPLERQLDELVAAGRITHHERDRVRG